MARHTTSARRYAEAAFEIADAEGNVEAWLAQLERLAAALADEQVVRRLANPQVPFGERQHALMSAAAEAPPEVANLVALLMRRRRLDQLPAIAHEFRRLYNRREGIVEAIVTSAGALDAVEIAEISGRLQRIAGGRIEIEQKVDPGLLGGVQVRLGDRLIDGSVRGRLERLRATLAARA
jgi:F-type H+-transporting ATPase subunit delta